VASRTREFGSATLRGRPAVGLPHDPGSLRTRTGLPRFVLLEHLWDGVHWDFMLERGEVLRTWAIDAPVIAGEDLPARALPDHRRIYLDYEGEISRDRGTVRRIDAGLYCAMVWTDDWVRVRLEGSQLVGEVELRQVGEKSDRASSWIFRLGNFD
jgi:hypothetical protein